MCVLWLVWSYFGEKQKKKTTQENICSKIQIHSLAKSDSFHCGKKKNIKNILYDYFKAKQSTFFVLCFPLRFAYLFSI